MHKIPNSFLRFLFKGRFLLVKIFQKVALSLFCHSEIVLELNLWPIVNIVVHIVLFLEHTRQSVSFRKRYIGKNLW